MIIIAGTISFDPAKREALESGFAAMQADTLKEAGCGAYEIYNSRSAEGTVLIFEKWESEEALAAHMVSPHMASFGGVMGAIGITGIDIKKYSGATEGPLR
jgi:quinol monooxygenase YgiN